MLSAEETLLPRVLEAIEKAPALPEIGFEQYTLEQLLSQPKFCSAMSHGTGLKRIRCYGMYGALEWDKERWQNVPEEVKEHIMYEETHFYAMKAKWLDEYVAVYIFYSVKYSLILCSDTHLHRRLELCID